MRSPLRGSGSFVFDVTQGSQNLALGLTLTAASQLVGHLFFDATQGSQNLALGLALIAASQLGRQKSV